MKSENNNPIKLGLIGDNIAASSSPRLHSVAGAMAGLNVEYLRLVPAQRNQSFDDLLDHCQAEGFQGLNITYPYKERVMSRITRCDPMVWAIGAVNTVRFSGGEIIGYNTDYSGFMAAYQTILHSAPIGTACLLGCGGVGRAIAFGLLEIGAEKINLFDNMPDKAAGLKRDLLRLGHNIEVEVFDDPQRAAQGCTGVLNATPVGMYGYEGSPVNLLECNGVSWVFDAVYTPLNTEFLQQATAKGAAIVNGWELFFWQGVQAFSIFTGGALNRTELRRKLWADVVNDQKQSSPA